VKKKAPELANPHLADQHRNPLLGKLPHRPGIPIEIPRGETLVSRVEKRIVLLLQKDVQDLVPLFGRRVDSLRGVAATRTTTKTRTTRTDVRGPSQYQFTRNAIDRLCEPGLTVGL
jgi:hypothetical protein